MGPPDGDPYVAPRRLGGRFGEILSCAEGLTEDDLRKAVKKSRVMYNHTDEALEIAEAPPTALSRYGRDLTALARQGKLDPLIGRTDELRKLFNILSRRTKNNPVVLGESGVGKTALVEGLAQRVAAGDCPPALRGAAIITLDMGMLMAGATFPGEFEQRMSAVLKELTELPKPPQATATPTSPPAEPPPSCCILFIDDIHNITGPNAQQGGGVNDASLLLKPLLARGELRCVGATTPDKYRRFIEKDPALERRFQTVREVDRRDALVLSELEAELAGLKAQRDEMAAAVERQLGEARELQALTAELESLHEALEAEEGGRSEAAAAEGANRPKSDAERIRADRERKQRREALLAKLNAAQEAARKRRAAQDAASGHRGGSAVVCPGGEVTEADISSVISSWTGIPLTKLVASECDSLLKLGDELHRRGAVDAGGGARSRERRIIGQEEAVSAVAEAIHRNRAGLKDPNGPIASFLFLGPTGVGKTELAKALAANLFNAEDAMVRLDMSEYMEKHAVSKLIGAPPGYVGFDEGGQLTEAVRRRPYTVVLFDEVEKAHVDVFNLLLQLLDDGRLSDSQGRTVSFKHTIIIMTSNLGSGEIYRATAGRSQQGASVAADPQIRELVMEQVRRHFPPEFLNRVDEFIIFEPLVAAQIRSVVALRLRGLVSRLGDKNIRLQLDDSAMDYLAAKGFDPIFGARPVKRAIQRELETPLAQALLRGDFEEEDTILVSMAPDGAHLTLTRLKPGEQAPPPASSSLQPPAAAAAVAASGPTENGAPANGTAPPGSLGASQPPPNDAGAANARTDGAGSGGDSGAAKGKGGATSRPLLPPRKNRFDPTRALSAKHAAGEDIGADGAAANRDDFSLPTSAT
ncbi:hypothetical protein GPECTOR_27g632 [Gonium pectorale]|uniref:UVR domain-containing protein n=1 Tax=Gonium pectorale TaxID=33097 RepID=A0A150GF42_GONPE|nr:hypothetical protein GPECTOR_27g632 [Gonium pectorale]|eukprot:KXZ48462.1 hypothetical protein GPECTOR_27g632 [Gonium pectorale]